MSSRIKYDPVVVSTTFVKYFSYEFWKSCPLTDSLTFTQLLHTRAYILYNLTFVLYSPSSRKYNYLVNIEARLHTFLRERVCLIKITWVRCSIINFALESMPRVCSLPWYCQSWSILLLFWKVAATQENHRWHRTLKLLAAVEVVDEHPIN